MKLRIRFNSWLLRKAPFLGRPRGMVVFPWVLFRDRPEDVLDSTIRHEMFHVHQILRDGWWKFHINYLGFQLRYGYWNNPYEIEARKFAEGNTPLPTWMIDGLDDAIFDYNREHK